MHPSPKEMLVFPNSVTVIQVFRVSMYRTWNVHNNGRKREDQKTRSRLEFRIAGVTPWPAIGRGQLFLAQSQHRTTTTTTSNYYNTTTIKIRVDLGFTEQHFRTWWYPAGAKLVRPKVVGRLEHILCLLCQGWLWDILGLLLKLLLLRLLLKR